jgi:hypothetical protein
MWIAIGITVWVGIVIFGMALMRAASDADDLAELEREQRRRDALAKIVEEVRTRDRRGPSEVA